MPSDFDQDALRELMECNLQKSTWKLALDLNISEFIICLYLQKIGKVNKLGDICLCLPPDRNWHKVFLIAGV